MSKSASAPVMLPTPSSWQDRPATFNNQAAVGGLLRQKYRESQMRGGVNVPRNSAAPSSSSSGSPPPGCPMHAGGSSSSSSSSGNAAGDINPDNNMPFNLRLSPQSSSADSPSSSRVKLSEQRVVSTIPRGATSPAPGASPYDKPSACPVAHTTSSDGPAPSNWEYPSAAQFQAALIRKNKAAPDEAVEMMVAVHNFMNEEAWKLVLEWETKHFGTRDAEDCSLLRFQGRPGELSPRAKWYGFLGSIMPSRYSSTPPFDRHDWIVGRKDGSEARYVIDYYGDDEADAEDERRRRARQASAATASASSATRPDDDDEDDEDEDDQARFILDVRPAMDDFASIRARASSVFAQWKGAA